MAFDLETLFEDHDIKFWTKGKNCTPGYVNITCVFCSDNSNHLGINRKSGKARCWKCGSNGDIYNVLQELMDINFKEAKKIVKRYQTDFLKQEVIKAERPSSLILPKDAIKLLPDLHKQYLIGRGFNPTSLQEKYKLLACGILGEYKFRLIIPIYFKHRLVNFAAMSVGGAKLKIMNCPNDKVILQRNELLYNYDNIKNRKAIIVEGFVDCWKMGDSCIATLGTEFSPTQVKLISEACDEAFIMYDSKQKDPQAPTQAEKLANQLYGLGCKSEVIDLEDGDPGDLSLKEAAKIKAELLN